MKTRLLTTLTAALLALSSYAAGTEIDGIHYELESSTKTASVTYTGSSGNYNPSSTAYTGSITIPSTVTSGSTTYSVTYIGEYAFSGCSGLTSITIPNSVTTIRYCAFEYCSGLTSITIPNSVTAIESYAFYCCSGLTSITIPNSVTAIGLYAFSGCRGLTSITIPNSVTSIGEDAFSGCTGLTSVTINSNDLVSKSYTLSSNLSSIFGTQVKEYIIGEAVTTIRNFAFDGCTSLTSITIPSSVKSIGNYAFSGCTGLTSVTIPSSVTSIGSNAFSGCTGLTSIKVDAGNTKYDSRNDCNAIIETATNTLVAGCKNTTIPNSVTTIGDHAFYCCSNLTSITIPNSVTTIGNYALYYCSGLTSITIPNSVTTIGNNAFCLCSSLTSITIPNSVTTIGDAAFAGCSGLTSIKVDAGNTKYDSRNDCNAIIETATNTLVAGCKNTTIPNSVTTIGDAAFYGCSGLTSITIPNSVTTIGNYAFSDCTGLTSITIPNSVTSIAQYAFSGCTGLTSIKIEAGNTKFDSRDNCNAIIETASNTLVAGCKATTIPNSVTSIGLSAFENCTSLTSITIPNSVTSINSMAFSRCTGLTSITLSWDDPTNCTYGSAMFDYVPTTATLYVPAGTKALYENTEPWSSFENIEEIEEKGKSVITLNNTMGTYCDASGLDFSSVEGLEAYTATGYASGEVTLTRVNYVPANTGIVLRGTAGVYDVPKQKVSAYLTNLLKGTTSPITLNQTEGDMTNYILANGSKGIGFYKVASVGGTLAANKAYLQLPSNLSATRPMMLRFEDEDGQTTDIQYLYTSSDDETAPAIFDLQGRRVNGTMQQGGIYIVGGKKVMAK